MDEAQYFERFALPTTVRITQNVHEKIEAARLWSLEKGIERVEVEMFYLTSDASGRVIEDILLTEQSAAIAKTETEGDSYLKAVSELDTLNRQRLDQKKPLLYLVGHHHFHPGSIGENVSDFPPFRSSDDEKVYRLVASRAYGAIERVVDLPYELFEGEAEYSQDQASAVMRSRSRFDPQLSLPVDKLSASMQGLRADAANNLARQLLSNLKISCNHRYGFAYFTIMNLNGGRPYCALGFLSRNLTFETQDYRVFNLPLEIEIIPSYSIDKTAFRQELEQKVKLNKPDQEPEDTLSKRLSGYLSTLLGRKNTDYYLSGPTGDGSVIPLFPFPSSPELTAREFLGELDLFFTVLGEKGIESHPALRIFAELHDGLGAMTQLTTYREQQAFLRLFLSRFSTGYERFLSRLEHVDGSADADNVSSEPSGTGKEDKDDTPK